MKFSLALAAAGAVLASANPFAPVSSKRSAKAAYLSKLVRSAKATSGSQLRRLDGEEEEYEVDLSTYSIKFQKCQFIKAYDDELAEDEDSETVLATKRFVIFRLCPNNSCSSCNYGYGEYLVDLEEYLQNTVEYQQQLQEEMCEACDECGGDDEAEDGGRRLANVDCDSCYDECQKIANMEENGYIDATEFLECQMIYDPEDDGKAALYAGPVCAGDGSKIKIGVFYDENCNFIDSSKDVDDYLVDGDGYSMKLSHALLKTVYSEDSCVSCLVPAEEDENQDDNNNGDDQEEEEPEVLEMCRDLYEQSAKCEVQHGFDNAHEGYNQAQMEEVNCDFIDSISAGSYGEDGEIVINGANASAGGGAKTTGGQKFALTFFILGTVGLAFYAAMLHSQLTKGGAAGLSDQGGAMA